MRRLRAKGRAVSSERRDWSFITGEQFESYLGEAQRLIEIVRREGIHPFAAGLAGVAFIRTALQVMGGRVEWWLDFVRSGQLPGLDFSPVSRNPPRA